MHEIAVGGQIRTLRFASGALAAIELASGQPIGYYMQALLPERFGFAAAIWLIWGGLQHETPAPTKLEVTAWIDRHIAQGGHIFDLRDPLAIALAAFLVPAKESPPKPAPEAESLSLTSGGPHG